jgi:hypothetical protein
MNVLTIPALLLLACVQLRADIVVEQKTEGPTGPSVSKLKVKGDRARVDTESKLGNITVLLDKSGKMVTYVHKSKLALTTTMTESQKTAKELLKKAGADTTKPDPFTKTGETEKVGDWTCDIWIRHTPSVTYKEWRAKDVPNLKRIQEQMAVLASIPGMDLGRELQSDTYTVKTERNDTKGTTTMTVARISEEAVQDSEFTAPEGFREMAVPAQ